MKFPFSLIIVIFLLCSSSISGQKFKFKKVTEEMLEQKEHPKFPDSDAAFLYKESRVELEYSDIDNDFLLNQYIVQRIKIYNENGYEWSDFRILLDNDARGNGAKVIKLDAYTFNLVGGKAESVKLDKKEVYGKRLSKYWSEKTFAMPKIQAGSIIEIRYQIQTPFFFKLPEFYYQESIPVDMALNIIKVPEYYNYNKKSKGFVPLETSSNYSEGKITYRDKTVSGREVGPEHAISYKVNIEEIVGIDVPPIEDEPFVTNMSNYKSSLEYELLSTTYPWAPIKYYTKTWDDIAKALNGSSAFGKVISDDHEGVDLILSKAASYEGVEKAAFIYHYINQNFAWNEYNGIYSDGLKELMKDGGGSLGDINLLLINVLQKAGFDVSPIVLKTRSEGFLNVSYPSRADLNMVIAGLNLETGTIFLDASIKGMPFGLLPKKAMNIYAIKLDGDTGIKFQLPNPNKLNEVTVLNLTLTEEKLSGVRQSKLSDKSAYYKKLELLDLESDEDQLQAANEANEKVSVVSCEYTIPEEMGKPIKCKEEVDYSSYLQNIDGKIFIPITLGMGIDENPFKKEDRSFAIFYDNLSSVTNSIGIELPEGFAIESIPKPFAISLGEKEIICRISAKQIGNKLNISYQYKRDVSLVSPEQYPYLVQFLDTIVSSCNEQIVLSKT